MDASMEEEVFAQHAIEAGFLWAMRDGAAHDPAYDLATLSAVDERLEANLDGLRLAGDAGWAHCLALLDGGEAGEVFTAAAIAVDRGDLPGLATVLDAWGGDAERTRAMVAALGWASFDQVRAILPGLLHGECPPALHYLGIAACAVHRQDPGTALGYAAVSTDARLRARALVAAGELGRTDLVHEMCAELGSDVEAVRFAAGWSAVLLGERQATETLRHLAWNSGPFAEEACDLVVRRMEPDAACAWLTSLAHSGSAPRAALAGAAALGDPSLVPWLLECLELPEIARPAAFAFAMITGADLAAEKATRRKAPEGFQAGPSDDPNSDDVAMDPDHGLPWPDPGEVRASWSKRSRQLRRGTRYLLGKPLTPEHLRQVLRTGNQAARAGAAVELGVREARGPLFSVRAPAFRQRKALG